MAIGHPIHFTFGSRVSFSAGRHLGKLQQHRAVSLRQLGFLVKFYIESQQKSLWVFYTLGFLADRTNGVLPEKLSRNKQEMA